MGKLELKQFLSELNQAETELLLIVHAQYQLGQGKCIYICIYVYLKDTTDAQCSAERDCQFVDSIRNVALVLVLGWFLGNSQTLSAMTNSLGT